MARDKILLGIDMVLAKGMIPVIRKRNIVKAMLIPRGHENAGSILISTASGVKGIITRRELVTNYRHLNNKKIVLAGIKSGKEYIFYCQDNSNALASLIPLKYSVEVNGIRANSSNRKTGDYIVVDVGEDGKPLSNTIGILPSALFKKMYYIPPNDIIYRQKRRTNNSEFNFGDSELYSSNNDAKLAAKQSKIELGLSKKPEQSPQISRIHSTSGGYKYRAIARLVNSNGELVGFIVQANNGQSINVTKEQMMAACRKHLVSNIMIGRKENGHVYLRGNNIRIENLPAQRV